MPPKTSSMYPSSISRALCSDGMRCIKPLAPSRNETNSSRVNGGADGAILGICAYSRPDQAGIRRFPRWPVSDGLQDGKAPAALLESHGGILPKPPRPAALIFLYLSAILCLCGGYNSHR